MDSTFIIIIETEEKNQNNIPTDNKEMSPNNTELIRLQIRREEELYQQKQKNESQKFLL